MSELVADCPRCGSKKITFDLTQQHFFETWYGWQCWVEAFCICRHCRRATIFILSQKTAVDKIIHEEGLLKLSSAVNRYMKIESYVSLKDMVAIQPPEHLPKDIEAAFREGAACISIKCYNAAGTMFRLCIDLATQPKLPKENKDGLNARIRRNLGLRLPWLFEHDLLPKDLQKLSTCVKEGGDDGAHVGNLTENDTEDLLDFTIAILERLYTEPERLRLATVRKDLRRGKKA